MAQRLTALRAFAAAGAFALCGASAAQPLTDPTRPPVEMMRAAAAQSGALALDAGPPAPRLEQILLSSARKGAIIDGRYVPLGGVVGKAKLVEVRATGVSLEREGQLEVIQLFPYKTMDPGVARAGGKSEEMAKRP